MADDWQKLKKKIIRLQKICKEAETIIQEIEEVGQYYLLRNGTQPSIESLVINPHLRTRFLNVCSQHDINTVPELLKVSPLDFIYKFNNAGKRLTNHIQHVLKKQYGIEWK